MQLRVEVGSVPVADKPLPAPAPARAVAPRCCIDAEALAPPPRLSETQVLPGTRV